MLLIGDLSLSLSLSLSIIKEESIGAWTAMGNRRCLSDKKTQWKYGFLFQIYFINKTNVYEVLTITSSSPIAYRLYVLDNGIYFT
jgi:hypothetical protein